MINIAMCAFSCKEVAFGGLDDAEMMSRVKNTPKRKFLGRELNRRFKPNLQNILSSISSKL